MNAPLGTPDVAHFSAAGNVIAWVRTPATSRGALSGWLAAAQAGRHAPEIIGVLRPRGEGLAAEFYNPDGTPERLCGNALRCLPLLLGLAPGRRVTVATALAPVVVFGDDVGHTWAVLPLASIVTDRVGEGDLLVDVGTPHRVRVVDDVVASAVTALGQRWSRGPGAVNATFVRPGPRGLTVRTLERGVATETASCGTGAAAAVLAFHGRAAGAHTVTFPSGEVLTVRIDGGAGTVAIGGACAAR